MLSLVTLAVFALTAAAAERSISRPIARPSDLTRVTIQLEAGGHNLVRAEADAQSGDKPEQKLPMSVSAKLEYDERRLDTPFTTA